MLSRQFYFVSFIFLLFGACNICKAKPHPSDFVYMKDRISEWYLNEYYVKSDSVTKSYLDLLDESGRFPDIDYDSHEPSAWAPIYHLERLMQLAGAYNDISSSYCHNDILYAEICKSLDFYIAKAPWSTNWYKGQIWEPRDLGLLTILMSQGENAIPTSMKERIIEKWRNCGADPSNFSAANRTEVATHYVYFACILEDPDLLHSSLDYIFEPLNYRIGEDEEGIQVDNSYYDNGPQLYIGGYGIVMIDVVTRFGLFCKGTEFAIPKDRFELLRNFVFQTVSNSHRGRYLNYNCIGRTVARRDYLLYGSLIRSLSKMKDIDEESNLYPEYDWMIARLKGSQLASYEIKSSHTHYFKGDYTVHTRPRYNFSIRMTSTRTRRNETMNEENIRGYYISDGSTDIRCTGDEYLNIFPLWDWKRVPGVTIPQKERLTRTFGSVINGTSKFAGGVSDSIFGVTAYKYYDSYQDTNTGASKGYFFFDDEVVCLGAGIKSDYPTMTGVDQTWGGHIINCLKADWEMDTYNESLNEDLIYNNDLKFIHHNNMGYYFPEGGIIRVRNKDTEGRWTDINASGNQDSTLIKGKIFSIAIDHYNPSELNGIKKYAYVIVPGVSITQMKQYVLNNSIRIIQNNDTIQSVAHINKDIIGIIFYKEGSLEYSGYSIEVDRSCVVLIKNIKTLSLMEVHIADPSQSGLPINISISNNKSSFKGLADFSKDDENYYGTSKKVALYSTSTGILNQIVPKFVVNVNNKNVKIEGQSSLSEGNIEVFSESGVQYYSVPYKDVCYIQMPSAGIFFLKININGKTETKKIIVK